MAARPPSLRILPSARPEEMDGLPASPFWSTLFGLTRPYRREMLWAAVCSVCVGVAIAFQQNLFLKWFIDEGVLRTGADGELAPPAERFRYSLLVIGGYLGLSVWRMGIWTLGYRGMLRAIEGVLCRLRGRFFRHVQALCFRFHDQVPSGELFNYIMGSPINTIKTFLQQVSMNVPYQIVSWVVAVAVLASFNVIMTVITVLVAAVVIGLNYRSRFVIRELSADFLKTESSVSKYVADMLQGCRAIKLYAMEENACYSFEYHVDRIRSKGLALAMQQQIEGLKPEAVQYAGYAVIGGCGAWFCLYQGMTPGALLAFLGSYTLLMGPLMMMLQLNLIRANAEAGLDRIMRVLQVAKSTPEPGDGERRAVGQQAAAAARAGVPCVAFEGVDFAYADGNAVFSRLSCTVPHGQSVALVGDSGSGKSTFVSLLLRFYDPQAGRILLNGESLARYGLQDLRASFGVVPQNPFIFQGSVLDNVRVARPEATAEEVREALRMAALDDFVAALPQGVETWLGEGGSNLSGGQRQRLAIARAVVAQPLYYIFDEATSALDNESESRIQRAMENLMRGHTTFVIAHRLSTIRHVDRVLVFAGGQIVQDGAYAALAGQPGRFRELLAAAGMVGEGAASPAGDLLAG